MSLSVSLSVSGTTSTSISVTASIDGSYSSSDRDIMWQINGTNDGSPESISAYTSSVSHTFSGLTPSTTYTLRAILGGFKYVDYYELASDDSGGSFSTNFSTLYSDYEEDTSTGDITTSGSATDVTWEPFDSILGTKHLYGGTSADSGYVSYGSEVYYITDQEYGYMEDINTGEILKSDEYAYWSTRYYMKYGGKKKQYDMGEDYTSGTTMAESVTKYTVTMVSGDSNYGSVSVNKSSVEYGSTVQITATPYTDCIFSEWVLALGSASITDMNSATTTVTVYSDCTIYGLFNKYFTVSVSENNSTYGTASASPTRSLPNKRIDISSAPNKGYEFVEWNVISGDIKQINDNSWFWMPESDVSIQAIFQKKPRPDYFEWDTPKVKGETFNLTASEWNGLRSNINLVLTYKGQSAYAFQSVNTGEKFTADHYNAAVMAIQSVSGYGTSLSDVTPKKKITASCLNLLVSEVNAIP